MLSLEDLHSCLGKGEGARLEFKRELPQDERVGRTLVAFANTRGGLLLVGVTDRGRVHGVHRPDEVRERLAAIARHKVDPVLCVELQVLEVHGPRVVACSVPFSKDRPHRLLLPDGELRCLVRVGASNRPAEGPTLRALSLARRSTRGLSPLERAILEWVGRQARHPQLPSGQATVARFAQGSNLGEGRARKSFVRLETLGLLVGHGAGRARVYHTP